jgi:hypothetical protein
MHSLQIYLMTRRIAQIHYLNPFKDYGNIVGAFKLKTWYVRLEFITKLNAQFYLFNNNITS